MKNGFMKKGMKLWLVGMIAALCLIPGIPSKAEKKEEIPYEESQVFKNGKIVEIEKQWAVSYLKNHIETSFEVNCDKEVIKEYLEELCDDFFTCRVEENGVMYTEVPLSVEFDLSDFDVESTEEQEVQIHFAVPEGLSFAEECESSFGIKFQLRSGGN